MGKRAKLSGRPIAITQWRDISLQDGLFRATFLSGDVEFTLVMSPHRAIEATKRAMEALRAENVVKFERVQH